MKSLMIFLLFLLLCSNLLSFAGGNGSAGDPWQIANPAHLEEVASYLGSIHADKHFILISDIDLDLAPYNSGEGWLPIGNASNQFAGKLEGNGFLIENLFIDRPANWYIALIGYTHSEAILSNLELVSVNITGYSWVGGLAGLNLGSISNCSVEGDITGSSRTGGLVGRNLGHIDACSSAGSVLIVSANDGGGLVGRNYAGLISNSHSSSTVTGYGNNSYGGLVGWNDSYIDNCYATGDVTGSRYSGGLVGRNYDGTISNSFATGNVISNTNSSGGLVGNNGGLPSLHNPIIIHCYATGDVQGASSIGGLAGENYNLISNSYATGTVWGSNSSTYQQGVGGLVGELHQNAIIEFCYAVGEVGGNAPLGGLVGFSNQGIVNCSYWNYETTNQYGSAGGSSLNTLQMLQAANYLNWDFFEIWQNIENITYPFQQQNPQNPPPAPDIPIIIVTPLSFSLLVEPNTVTEEFLLIQNIGSLDLTFDISIEEMLQNNSAKREEWLIVSPLSGTVAPEDSIEISITFDAGVVNPGAIYIAEIIIENNAGEAVIVDVCLEISLPYLPPPENLQAYENTGYCNWNEPNYNNLELLYYNVYLDEAWCDSTTATGYQFSGLINGETYTVGVSAVYDLGESTMSTQEFVYLGVSSEQVLLHVVTNLTNYPNPFNPITTIEFGIREGESGTLTIYNILGQKVLSRKFEAGFHTFNWDASNQASGVYLYRLQTPSYYKTNRMLMLK